MGSLMLLNVLRFLTDAAIYYSFAGVFVLKAGGGNILPGLLIPALCYGLSRYFLDVHISNEDVSGRDSGAARLNSEATRQDSGATRRDSGAVQFNFGVVRLDSDAPLSDSGAVRPDSGTRNLIFRLLCPVPCCLCLALPDLPVADRIAALPPILYAILLIYHRDYTLSAYRQNDIFNFFWKVYSIFAVLCLLLGNLSELTSASMPAAVCALTISVYLLRVLRHDPEVYHQPAFLLRSAVPLFLLGLFAGLFSIPGVLSVLTIILYTLYSITLVPLLMGISSLLGWILLHTLYPLLQWLASLTKQKELSLELNNAANTLQSNFQQEERIGITAQQILHNLGITILFLVVLLLLFLLYRKLTELRYSQETASAILQQQTPAAGAEKNSEQHPRPFLPGMNPASQIQRTYRSYLKLCRQKGFIPPSCYTSQEIAEKSFPLFHDPENVRKISELRELYIQARYHGTASAAQARRARELLAELKKMKF